MKTATRRSSPTVARSDRRVALAGAALAVLIGCRAAGALAADIPPGAMKEADEIYKTRCTTCHGPEGKGDGPAGVMLNPRPRDLGDAAWQKTVDDAHIEKIILEGGPSVGKSPLMPANPDLASKPDVVKALRQMVRNLGAKK